MVVLHDMGMSYSTFDNCDTFWPYGNLEIQPSEPNLE